MPLALAEPVKLPCGLVLPNRIAKASLTEVLATKGNLPNQNFTKLYKKWADGGWGCILTGNVQVDSNHLGSLYDAAFGPHTRKDNRSLKQWSQYAETCQQNGTPTIVQLSHPGRQSPRGSGRGVFAQSLAPSAIPLKLGDSLVAHLARVLVFGTPREMTVADIEMVVSQFVDAARFMAETGFSGVQLHAAHGYLLAEFLSPTLNKRTDEYGGTPEKRARIVLDIIRRIRQAVPSDFCIGIKLNSTDHHATDFEETMRQIELLVECGIDFLEVSGGTYEDPKMLSGDSPSRKVVENKSQRTLEREAYFLEFATEARKRFPNLVLMVTGGFRSRRGAEAAVQSKACDIVGVGRPAAVDPNFSRLLLDETAPEDQARLDLAKVSLPFWANFSSIKPIGGGAETVYYVTQMHRLVRGLVTSGPKWPDGNSGDRSKTNNIPIVSLVFVFALLAVFLGRDVPGRIVGTIGSFASPLIHGLSTMECRLKG